MRIRFNGDELVRLALESELPGHFDYARRLLRYWLEAEKDRGLKRCKLPPIVLRILMAMSVKSCRQFRTVIELCERGEAADASNIARAMFETALVVGFVLKHRFVPRRFNNEGVVTARLGVPGVILSRKFRATLFAAHHVFQPDRFALMHGKRRGVKREAKRAHDIALMGNVGQQYRNLLGQGWTDILLKHPRTYSGLSIADLARSLGRPFSDWYDHIYGHQSHHVHASDLLHHITIDRETAVTSPRWHEDAAHVRSTLQTAITMFFATVGILNEHIGFGVGMNSALAAFAADYHELLKREL